jgi:hypothetical protein
MALKTCSDDEFVRLFQSLGATETARQLGCNERSVYARRARMAKFDQIVAPTRQPVNFPGRLPLEIRNGTALIGSDFHIWPGEPSTCLRAFKKFIADIKPNAVILNGDVLDLPRASRHPALNWERAPDPQEEVEAVQDHLSDIEKSCKRGTRKIWTLGNHDARWEMTFANTLPQMRGVNGVHLHDHFPTWERAMSCFINEGIEGGATMVKHRWKGGMNATRANTLNAGVSMVTGHLHSQNVRPLSDYRRHDRYGVDTGCVADKEHRAFSYTEDAALDWRSGFALLTYKDGILMPPELVTKMSPNSVWFRGQIHKV